MSPQEEVPLGNPDILVCSVGTEIFYEANGSQAPTADKKWGRLLDQGWNRDLIVKTASKFSGLKLQVLVFRLGPLLSKKACPAVHLCKSKSQVLYAKGLS